MFNEESILIQERFYKALDKLIQLNALRGVKTFTDRYNINRWNFITQRNDPARNQFQMSWIKHIHKDFGINSSWIITGEGNMFLDDRYQH